MTIERITAQDELLAIIIRSNFNEPGCTFLTPNEFPFQVGVHLRREQEVVAAHQHLPFKSISQLPAQEFFYIIAGRIKVKLFHNKQQHSIITLNKGDAILINCGHEITFLGKTKMIELKQGPYRGKDQEKEYF